MRISANGPFSTTVYASSDPEVGGYIMFMNIDNSPELHKITQIIGDQFWTDIIPIYGPFSNANYSHPEEGRYLLFTNEENNRPELHRVAQIMGDQFWTEIIPTIGINHTNHNSNENGVYGEYAEVAYADYMSRYTQE